MLHTENKKSMLSQGIIIFVYLAVLTGLEFLVAISFASVPLLIIVALIKSALVVYYYMHVYKLNLESESEEVESYEYKSGTNRLGLWLFLVSDSFVFAGLMAMRINLLGITRPELNQLLGLGVTAVLLISSFFMNRGELQMHHGDRQGFLVNTAVTFLMGLGFLLGVVLVEWRLAIEEGLTPSSGPAGAAFFMMTGMHAFHVFSGLIILAIIWFNGRRGLYDEKNYPVEAAAVYWHFVDVVWIFFYPALYLIGTAVR
jgi:cytochrome c oxidase subunit III